MLSGIYAAALEAVQIVVPGRTWEWWDLAAGALGIGVAAALMAWRRARLALLF
jgi:VanZ family protein